MKKTGVILGFLLALEICSGHAQEVYLLQYKLTDPQGTVSLEGEESFLDSLSRKEFYQSWVEDLHQKGFLSAHIRKETNNGDTLSLVIHKGELYSWMELRTGNLEEKLLHESGYDERRFHQKDFSIREMNVLFERLLKTSQNNGYPFASVRLDSLEQIENQFQAAIHFDYGPFITFDTLQITGNSKTRPVFLSRYLSIQPGNPFSQKKIDQSIPTLRNLPYVQIVSEPELSFQNSEAILYLPLNERRVNTLDGIIGVLPNEIEDNKLLVTGQFDLGLYNVGGRGRNFRLNWQRLSQYSQNLRISAEEPLLLGSSIGVKASFFLLKEDTSFLNRDLRLDLGHRLSPASYLNFFTRRQAGDLLAVSRWTDTGSLPEVADFRFNNYGLNFLYSTLDDILLPRRGWYSELEFGIGNKRILQNTGLPEEVYQGIEMSTIQYYIKASAERHIYFRPAIGAMLRISAGNLENPNLLLNDLYRLGGLKSIRGFNENYFFANRYVYANFEPRYYFDANSYFLLFTDWGWLENRIGQGNTETPKAFGGGFSLQTNAGIFNFVYALGSSQEQPIGFNFSRIHFGYTGRF